MLLCLTVVAVSAQTPAPNQPSDGAVESRVESLLRQMTLEEKVDMLGGVDGFFVRGIPRLGLPRLKMADGLSYTNFSYSNLSVQQGITKGGSLEFWWAEVSFDVTNNGKRAGAEVAKVYVSNPQSKVPRPAKELKGLAKIDLKPGEKKRIKVMLNKRSFSYYDVSAKQWRAKSGNFDVLVGPSSSKIELRGKISLSPGSIGQE
jgi:beta-glucosidase